MYVKHLKMTIWDAKENGLPWEMATVFFGLNKKLLTMRGAQGSYEELRETLKRKGRWEQQGHEDAGLPLFYRSSSNRRIAGSHLTLSPLFHKPRWSVANFCLVFVVVHPSLEIPFVSAAGREMTKANCRRTELPVPYQRLDFWHLAESLYI